MKSKASEPLIIQSELEDSEPNDEFYDALVRGESFEDEDSDADDDDDVTTPKVNIYGLNYNCVIQMVILCWLIYGDPTFLANFYAGWKGEVEERIMGYCRFSYEAI